MEHQPEQALHANLATNVAWVRRIALAIGRDNALADDLAQDAALAALEHPPGASASVRNWLAAVVRRLAIDRSRSEAARRHREQSVSRHEVDATQSEAAERGERARCVVEAVLALPEPLRATVLLRYLDQLELAEVARRSGVSERTVRTRLDQALATLRTRLEAEFGEDSRTWALAFLAPHLKGVTLLNGKLVAGIAVTIAVGAVLWARSSGTPDPEPLAGQASAAALEHEEPIAATAQSSDPQVEGRAPIAPPQLPESAEGWHFRVVDADSRRELAQAEATKKEPGSNPTSIAGDAQGRLALPRDSAASPALWSVAAPGHAQAALVDARGGTTANSPTEVPLRRSAALQVRVLDGSGQPVRAYIELSADLREMQAVATSEEEFALAYNGGPNQHRYETNGLGETSSGREHWRKRCDERGTCRWDSLPPSVSLKAVLAVKGQVLLRVEPFALEPGEDRNVDWRLPMSGALHVTLVESDGAPATGQLVWLVSAKEGGLYGAASEPFALFSARTKSAASARSGADGSLEFASVHAGDWYVGPAFDPEAATSGADPRAVPALGVLVHVDETGHAPETRITLERGLFVGGMVIGAPGASPPPVRLYVFADHVRDWLECTSDATGAFLAGPLPRIPLRLVPHLSMGGSLPDLRVEAGDLSVVIQVPSLTTLEVRAFDEPSGADLSIVSLSLLGQGNGSYLERETVGGSLAVTLEAVQVGRYSLVARTQDGRLALLTDHDVGRESSPVAIRIPAREACTLVVRNPAAEPRTLRVFLESAPVAVISVEGKGSTTERLPGGKLRFVDAREGRSSSEQQIELAPGATGTLDLK
jgi:RNA polymerase sigma-70 factor (ECF subfamily)